MWEKGRGVHLTSPTPIVRASLKMKDFTFVDYTEFIELLPWINLDSEYMVISL